MKIGFLGMGVMGLPMAKNLVAKSGHEILGYDVVEKQRLALAEAGGTAVSDPMEIYDQLVYASKPYGTEFEIDGDIIRVKL